MSPLVFFYYFRSLGAAPGRCDALAWRRVRLAVGPVPLRIGTLLLVLCRGSRRSARRRAVLAASPCFSRRLGLLLQCTRMVVLDASCVQSALRACSAWRDCGGPCAPEVGRVGDLWCARSATVPPRRASTKRRLYNACCKHNHAGVHCNKRPGDELSAEGSKHSHAACTAPRAAARRGEGGADPQRDRAGSERNEWPR